VALSGFVGLLSAMARTTVRLRSDSLSGFAGIRNLEGSTFKALLAPVVASDAVLVSDGRAAYGQFADAAGIAHITCIASADERVLGSYHVQNVNGYQSRLKSWMAPFKGVASWYLPNYLGWRRMIERDARCLTPRHIIAEAMGQTST
jgi:ISXO2-like transposase domain